MSYALALDQLLSMPGELHTPPGQVRRKFDLAQMSVLLAALGDPQLRFRSVLIAGTNGKGSTSAMLATIVAAAGYSVGLYTSPHLTRVNERIQVLGPHGGVQIGDEDFGELAVRVRKTGEDLVASGKLKDLPSFFETLTAIGMLAFAERRVDLAVLEVGLGGRLDATNVVEPLFSVITDISLDHTEWLGSTIAEITREKAGILRPGGTMITLPQHPEANQALGEAAIALNVRGISAAEYIPAPSFMNGGGEGGDKGRPTNCLAALGEEFAVRPVLRGHHQQRNIALAVAGAVELRNSLGYRITLGSIKTGLEQTRWPGRLEHLELAGGTNVLLDIAHNPAGAWALRASISELTESSGLPSPKVLIFSCLEDKAVEEMAQILFPVFDAVILTRVQSPRAAFLDRLRAAAERTGADVEAYERPVEAFEAARDRVGGVGSIVVAGSVYLVGELRPQLV